MRKKITQVETHCAADSESESDDDCKWARNELVTYRNECRPEDSVASIDSAQTANDSNAELFNPLDSVVRPARMSMSVLKIVAAAAERPFSLSSRTT